MEKRKERNDVKKNKKESEKAKNKIETLEKSLKKANDLNDELKLQLVNKKEVKTNEPVTHEKSAFINPKYVSTISEEKREDLEEKWADLEEENEDSENNLDDSEEEMKIQKRKGK